MLEKFFRGLAWVLILAGSGTLILAGYSYFQGEIEVSSRMHGTSVITLAGAPGPFYGFFFAYLFSGLLMIGLAFYILSDKGKK